MCRERRWGAKAEALAGSRGAEGSDPGHVQLTFCLHSQVWGRNADPGKCQMRSIWEGMAWDQKLTSLEEWAPPRAHDKGTWVQILQRGEPCVWCDKAKQRSEQEEDWGGERREGL